jgi:drug/metabolite transporter (DMT)-like permease
VAVLLALISAFAYGLSDFVGGLVSRRASVWSVAVTLQGSSAVSTALVSLFVGGTVTATDLGWATLSGVGSGIGVCYLFRGLSRGRMAVVAPLSAVGAALLPLAVALVGGERPSTLDLAGIAVALPGIWLVSSGETPPGGASVAASSGVGDGLVAGIGFGVMFVALAQIGHGAGLWPVALGQLVSALTAAALAFAVRATWRPGGRTLWPAAAAGPLGALAVVAYTLSTREGLLSISAVLSSLYPAATILLAATVLHERIRRPQVLGLLLCGLTVSLLAVS